MKSVAWMLAVALAALSTIAHADEKTDAKKAANEAYREGQRQYELNNFPTALEHFKQAYTLYDEPALLYNIAQCYRQLGDDEKANQFYKSYLRKVPDAPNRDEVARLIAALDKSSAEKRAAAEKQKAEAERLAQQRAQTETAERRAHAAELEAEATAKRRALERQEPRPSVPAYKRWWVWTTVGAVALVGVGVGVGVYYGTRSTGFSTSLPPFQLGLTLR